MKHEKREAKRARKLVAARLQVVLAALKDQLSGGTDAFWKKVEERWNKMQSKNETDHRDPPA